MIFSTPRPSLLHRSLRASLVAAVLFCCTGCLTFETLVTVRDDGSGTLEMVFALSGPMLEMITSMAGDDDLCDEEDLQTEADNMGEGVTLASVESIDEGDMQGCRVFYDFADVNQLTLSENPPGMTPDGPTEEEEDITFSFTPGSPATLMVYLPQNFVDDPSDESPQADTTGQAQQMAVLREMFQGAYVEMAVAVEGVITETNASYYDDNRVTLIEMDFDTLLENEEQLEILSAANPQSAAEAKALLEDVEGIKLETGQEVVVQFQ